MFKQRILSLLLSFCLLFSLGANSVLAAGVDSEYGILSWGTAAAPVYIWPTPNATTISQYYSASHTAIDISGKGCNVYTSRGGTIVTVYSGCTNVSGLASGTSCSARGKCKPKVNGKTSGYWNGYCNEGLGNGYIVQHSDGTYAGYGHLDTQVASLKMGSKVNQGTKLGTMGSSGRSTGPHLHFELRGKSSYGFWAGTPQNPLKYVSPNTENDKEPPSIIAVSVTNISASGYTIAATVADPSGVAWVKFPTWTTKNGQDDLAKGWKTNSSVDGKRSGNIYTFEVKASDHNNEAGEYITKIYAKDNKGNEHTAATAYKQVVNIYSVPKISEVRISDKSSSGYTVVCKVTTNDPRGIVRVQFPSWSEERGQGDLASDWPTNGKYKSTKNGDYYSFRVKASNYYNAQGLYITHIYAFDKGGQVAGVPAPEAYVREHIRMTDLSVSPAYATIKPGATLSLKTAIKPANAEDKLVVWSSSNTKVAKVSWDKGVVTAVSSGTATISGIANDGSGKRVSCEVKVYQQPTGVKLSSSAKTLSIGQSHTLSAVVVPTTASNKNLEWRSSNTKVATVNSKGKITAHKNGKTTITCTTVDGGKVIKCKVYVGKKVSSVKLNKSSKTLKKGESFQLTATVSPSNAANKTVVWTSSDSSVATVIKGKVYANNAGKVTITAKTQDRGKIATCKVKVGEAVTAVSLTQYKSINVGSGTTLKPQFTPSNVAIKTVTWKSSKPGIATVDAKGKVRGLKEGITKITCVTKDGKKKAKCVVYVGQAVTSVQLNKSTITLNTGDTYTLKATLEPKKTVSRNIKWTSSDRKVATVNSEGVVTAKAKGQATITCTATNGNRIATCMVVVQ